MYLDFNWRRFSEGSCSKLLCHCAEYFSIKVSSIGFHFVWFLTLFILLQLAGLAAVGQDCYGVFSLRGKLLNVREATAKQVTENKEIGYIKQSLGLQQHKEYTNVKSLRYGHLMIVTDQVRHLKFRLLFCSCFMLTVLSTRHTDSLQQI